MNERGTGMGHSIEGGERLRAILAQGGMVVGLLLLAPASFADLDDVPIETQGELREWCREESEALFVGRGITPYNWSASHWQEGNTLFVKGSWRVERGEAAVECRVAKGARRRYANVVVHDVR